MSGACRAAQSSPASTPASGPAKSGTSSATTGRRVKAKRVGIAVGVEDEAGALRRQPLEHPLEDRWPRRSAAAPCRRRPCAARARRRARGRECGDMRSSRARIDASEHCGAAYPPARCAGRVGRQRVAAASADGVGGLHLLRVCGVRTARSEQAAPPTPDPSPPLAVRLAASPRSEKRGQAKQSSTTPHAPPPCAGASRSPPRRRRGPGRTRCGPRRRARRSVCRAPGRSASGSPCAPARRPTP